MTDHTELIASAESKLAEENHEEALRLAEQAIELQPESAKAWFMKGKALFHLTEYVNATDALKFAVDYGIQGDDLASAESLSAEAMRKQIVKSVKRDWYQNDTHVIINVLIKKVKVDDVNIDYGEDRLQFSAKIPNSDTTYEIDLRLARKIEKEACNLRFTPSKVEIRLKKADGYRWNSLEADGIEDPNVKTFESAPSTAAAASATVTYPTSSKKPKNWDRLEKEVKQEEKDEKLEGDAALNKMFQQIYGDASEETRRAMNKSFQESNGTVLSTNWGEIGAKPTDMHCPDGMEFKQY